MNAGGKRVRRTIPAPDISPHTGQWQCLPDDCGSLCPATERFGTTRVCGMSRRLDVMGGPASAGAHISPQTGHRRAVTKRSWIVVPGKPGTTIQDHLRRASRNPSACAMDWSYRDIYPRKDPARATRHKRTLFDACPRTTQLLKVLPRERPTMPRGGFLMCGLRLFTRRRSRWVRTLTGRVPGPAAGRCVSSGPGRRGDPHRDCRAGLEYTLGRHGDDRPGQHRSRSEHPLDAHPQTVLPELPYHRPGGLPR